ncbi:MAG TPA: uroporphyrinogen-III C-methyltransferase [Burkholderiaceae bacterium]|nr:uroporphyrinogen-III C-methyltransferase [Burkholderiaceae bacterium]
MARRSPWPWIAAVAIVLSLAATAYAQLQLNALRKEAARRLADLEQASARATDTATRADAEARAARERAMVLEARLAEEQSQREALEQLYSDLSRGRDEAVLVEVERLVAVASQELTVSGNVNTALAALQTADLRLARSDNARFLPLRRIIARDVERLKVAPTVDITGMALKLDQIATGIDGWTLLSDVRPAGMALDGTAADTVGPSPGAPRWERWLERLRSELGDYRDLVRLRRVDTPESLLLQPQQQQLARLQIKLRLLSARQALLMRNDRLFRADLGEAQALVARYVDVKQPSVAAAVATMKQLSSTALSVEVPQINDSLAAVRAARTTPGR